jgi:hypothetical protein
MLTLNEQSTSRGGAGQRSMKRYPKELPPLSEEQRQIRAALVEYFSILQEWAHEDTAIVASRGRSLSWPKL